VAYVNEPTYGENRYSMWLSRAGNLIVVRGPDYLGRNQDEVVFKDLDENRSNPVLPPTPAASMTFAHWQATTVDTPQSTLTAAGAMSTLARYLA
jgi:hypothetical protein